MKIAMGGIAVECCTFSPVLIELEDFEILRGDALRARYPFISQYAGSAFSPLIFAKATPGGPVTGEAYSQLKEEYLAELQKTLESGGRGVQVLRASPGCVSRRCFQLLS